MKENGGKAGGRPGASEISSARAVAAKPGPVSSTGASRSRLPSPPQPGRPSPPLPAGARRPSPPPPLSARGGPGPQLRLKPPASSADDPTPRNFARAPLTARGAPAAAAAAPRRDGSLTSHGQAGSSYRDALARSTSTVAAGLVTPRGASNLPAPPPRRTAAAPTASAAPAAPRAASGGAAPAAPPPPPAGRQQQLEVAQQLARASHEQEQLQQHASRLEAGLEAQQGELQSRLAAVQMLGERREALAEHSATLQRLCLQAKMVEESRRAELQSLGLASDAARLSLERYGAQGEASAAALAAARSGLLHMLQSAAHALKLPELAAAIQRELRAAPAAAGGGSGPASAALATAGAAEPAPAAASAAAGAPAAASAAKPRGGACPASPSDAGSRGYATPAGSGASPASSCSDWSDRDSCSSTVSSPRHEGSGAGGDVSARLAAPAASQLQPQVARQRGPPLPPLRLEGLEAALPAAAGDTDGSRSARIPKSARIPGAALVSPLPAAPASGAASCPISPQVLQRLQSISSKLEAALADQALEVDSA